MEDLDKFDLAILSELQADNMRPQRDIAETIGLSAAAVQRRIKRLRAEKIITADTSILNREKVGALVTLLVEVSLHSERIDHIEAAKALFEGTPEVQQCYYVTGDYDFLLIILTPSMEAYERLTQKIFFSHDNVKSFKTSVALSLVKVGLKVPIPYSSQSRH
jgi:DNA-binding Lrp family transcriptional regulator